MTITATLSALPFLTAVLSGPEELTSLLESKELKAELGVEVRSGVTKVRIVDVALPVAMWIGETSPYYQVANIPDVTSYSKVDLQPSVDQLEIFYEKDITFSTVNDDGVVTVYAIGDKPTEDYIIQATVVEVQG